MVAQNIVPLVNKTEEGKLTRFFPLQRHLLLMLRETHLFKGHGYMGMCLVHDYFLCLDRPVKLNAQRFCDRWGICLSFFYKGRKELARQGLLKLSNKFVTICSHLVRCSEIEHPQGTQETELFAKEEFSNRREKILHLENENSSNALPATDCGDSLRSRNTRRIINNKLNPPPSPPEERGGLGREPFLEQSLIQNSEGVQLLERSGSKTYRYHEDKEQRWGEEVSDNYLVIEEPKELVPVEFGTQPNPDLEVVQDRSTTSNTPEEEAADEELTSLNTEPGSSTTTTDLHEGNIPGGENDSTSRVWDLEIPEDEEEDSFSDTCDEVVDAEIVEDAAIVIQEQTGALGDVVEEVVEYSPQVQRVIELYERTGITPRVQELNMWAELEIGEYVKLYRKSGRVLSSKPNDVVPEFRKFLIEKKEASNPIAWITKMEGDPKRWGELVDMVTEWQKKEFINSEEGKKLKMEYYESTGLGVTGRWQLD